jgi:nucleotide-binding universal stress UspA family protein
MAGGIILVPVDFEDASLRALALGQELARSLGAEVVLLHVYALPVYTYPGLDPTYNVPGFHAEVTAAAKWALDELASSQGGLRSILRQGDAATEILAAAKEHPTQLIVMGTHGRSGLAHLLLGSVAEKVVRQSPVPVLTVRS